VPPTPSATSPDAALLRYFWSKRFRGGLGVLALCEPLRARVGSLSCSHSGTARPTDVATFEQLRLIMESATKRVRTSSGLQEAPDGSTRLKACRLVSARGPAAAPAQALHNMSTSPAQPARGPHSQSQKPLTGPENASTKCNASLDGIRQPPTDVLRHRRQLCLGKDAISQRGDE
jgi:hypothetical protein